MVEWILLALLPLAALGGFWLARKFFRRNETRRNRQFSSRYFQGLNYLLNEQPDKAIQVFLEMAEVNKDTFETHLALGALFRRRGEVDRAIRIHQNIISKHNLDDRQRTDRTGRNPLWLSVVDPRRRTRRRLHGPLPERCV